MFYITISSKSKEVLKSFLLFLYKFKSNNLIIKYFPKRKIKKFITVLKSPHVNKSAQEQFEVRIYSIKLLISSEQNLKFLYFLKQVQNNIFSLLSLKIEGLFHEKEKQLDYKLNKLNPNKLNAAFFKDTIKNVTNLNSEKIEKYIDLLDCHGELSVKKINK